MSNLPTGNLLPEVGELFVLPSKFTSPDDRTDIMIGVCKSFPNHGQAIEVHDEDGDVWAEVDVDDYLSDKNLLLPYPYMSHTSTSHGETTVNRLVINPAYIEWQAARQAAQ